MTKCSSIERMLLLSVSFTIVLLVARMLYSGTYIYMFYVWNIWLAIIPVLASRQLTKYNGATASPWLLLLVWLLFLPNAPYLVTDVFHFIPRKPVPVWFDLLLVISGAWNGLMLGIVSLVQVETFLLKHLRESTVRIVIAGCILLCAFGVYLGRYLRLNSWDVVANPYPLAFSIGHRVVHPFAHVSTWAFTFLFAALLWIAYSTIRQFTTLAPLSNSHD